MAQLPDELLIKIFRYFLQSLNPEPYLKQQELSNALTLRNLSLTCKRFNNLVNNRLLTKDDVIERRIHHRTTIFNPEHTYSSHTCPAHHGTCTIHRRGQVCSYEQICCKLAANKFTLCRTLRFHRLVLRERAKRDHLCLNQLQASMTQSILELDLFKCEFSANCLPLIVSRLPNIKHLRLFCCTLLDSNVKLTGSHEMPTLISLAICSPNRDDVLRKTNLLMTFPATRLTYYSSEHEYFAQDGFFLEYIQEYKEILKKIDIVGCDLRSELRTKLTNDPRLQHIDINHDVTQLCYLDKAKTRCWVSPYRVGLKRIFK